MGEVVERTNKLVNSKSGVIMGWCLH